MTNASNSILKSAMARAQTSDVFVSGGGMVGLTLALALAQGGLQVAVADPLPAATVLDPAFDGRVSALSYASVRMFEALGLWDALKDQAQPIRDILVSDAGLGQTPSPFTLHFDHREIGQPLGYIVENRFIRHVLFEAVAKTDAVRLYAQAKAESFAIKDAGVSAELGAHGRITARAMVAAEGRESPSREAMNIGLVSWSYPQWGIVATVAHERPHEGVAYEHFLPSGPFAILPMTGDRSSLVWTERDVLAPAMLALPDTEFEAEIARRFGAHLGTIKADGPRWSYPLKFHLARSYVQPRFALAGDAAHGIHPIAGQGLNLGLKDAAALAEVLLDAARLGLDIGALDVLKRYERWRRFDSALMGFTMDAMNRLFSNDFAPVRVIRDLGIGITDRIGPLRRFLMRNAGGDVGKLPRLLKGEAA
ncbi:MAG TPA: FAD-dependent monooxygenase [Rhizomicrobium sp.]|nr:FAD-dependent monooxygenase [Rhizomicrobium sp.]